MPFLQLLKLNRPDWHLLLVGIVSSVILGALYPILAVIFSEVLEVGPSSFTKLEHSIVAPVSMHARTELFQYCAHCWQEVLTTVMYVCPQVYGGTDEREIERDVSRLAGGFVGLAVGASLTYFIFVSGV